MKSTKFKLLGAILSMTAVTASTRAADALSGVTDHVAYITIAGTNYAVVNMDTGPGSGRPACHQVSSMNSEYAFDISTDKGKAMLAMLQAALLAGKEVAVTGSSTCTNTGTYSFETLTEVRIFRF